MGAYVSVVAKSAKKGTGLQDCAGWQDGRMARCCVSVVARSAKFLDRIDYNLVWIWFGCCVSVVARCCVRVVCVIQLSRSGQASSWLCTKMILQDLRVLAVAYLWGARRLVLHNSGV